MDEMEMRARAGLRGLSDRIERVLMSEVPAFEDDAKMLLYGCYGLSQLLASRCAAHQIGRCDPAVVIWLVEGCGLELKPVESDIEQAGGWLKRRRMPTEFGPNELVLRALLTHINRYMEGEEPEYSALPVHELDRLLQRVRLLGVWEVQDAAYHKGLREALKGLERARDAAEYEPRN